MPHVHMTQDNGRSSVSRQLRERRQPADQSRRSSCHGESIEGNDASMGCPCSQALGMTSRCTPSSSIGPDESWPMTTPATEAPLPTPARVYDVRGSKVNPFLRLVPGSVANAPRWDLAAMPAWSLSFWDEVDFAFKVKGKRDMFPETDPPQFLKVRDPVSGLFRYFRRFILYGSRISAVRWQRTLHPFLKSIGFVQGKNEPCAFYHPVRKIKLLSYVDDLLQG